MKITGCSGRPIIEACGLNDIDYQVDPYIGCEHNCHYCYALNQAETDWSKEILIHENLGDRLREELDKITPQKIYMGYRTDPYQPCEADCRQTREVLELFVEKGFSASVLTKSDLVVRDIDLFKEMPQANVSVSVAFDDDQVRDRFEGKTIETKKRVDALEKIRKAGIRTSALVCPVIPLITNIDALLEMLEPAAERIWLYGLSILDEKDANWRNVKRIMDEHYPDKRDEIETITFDKENDYWTRLRKRLEILAKERQLNLSIHL